MARALSYIRDGYEWIVDLDIEKFFDTVNHDRLISILQEKVDDSVTIKLIRSFLKAGVMEDGIVHPTLEGVPQGGPLSPVLSNIYLDKMDKELEKRGLHFVRYADDADIFVRSEKAAQRVMTSISKWLGNKLRLKVSPTKTCVVRPGKSVFLGFTYWKGGKGWMCKPAEDRKTRLYQKIRDVLVRRRACAQKLKDVFTKVNQILRGWINYYGIGSMKSFLMNEFGPWMRHKIRVVIVKQWKRPRTIFKNLTVLNRVCGGNFTKEEIRQTANTRLGLYRQCGMRTINFLLSPKILAMPNKKKGRPGLVDPLDYYLGLSDRPGYGKGLNVIM